MYASVLNHLCELEESRYSPGTLANKDQVLRRYARTTGDPIEATVPAAEAWWSSLAAVGSSAKITYLAHVRTFYSWAARHDLREDDPTRRIVAPRTRPRIPRPVPHASALALFACLPGPDALAVGLMFGCGLRCAEVAGAEREHYDGADLWVLGKGERPRVVPVPGPVAALIQGCGPGPLLTGPDGRRLTPERISGRYGRLLRRHGIPATAHQLRHTFGTEAYRRLGDLRAVQILMGHTSISTTAGYVAVDTSKARAALADLAG